MQISLFIFILKIKQKWNSIFSIISNLCKFQQNFSKNVALVTNGCISSPPWKHCVFVTLSIPTVYQAEIVLPDTRYFWIPQSLFCHRITNLECQNKTWIVYETLIVSRAVLLNVWFYLSQEDIPHPTRLQPVRRARKWPWCQPTSFSSPSSPSLRPHSYPIAWS